MLRPRLALAGLVTSACAVLAPVAFASAADAAPGVPNLAIGSSGYGVGCVQLALDAASQNVTWDGEFGPQTQAGVENVQRFFGLQVDGIVGPQTGDVLWLVADTYYGSGFWKTTSGCYAVVPSTHT